MIAARRAAGEALAGTLNEQLKPSAILPALPAAAVLVALTQNINHAAAAISIISLVADSTAKLSQSLSFRGSSFHQTEPCGRREIGPVLA
jgi:hypothetical protein